MSACDSLTPRQQEAIEELLRRMRDGWTGELMFDFRVGEPKTVRRYEREALDGARGDCKNH